MSKLFAPALTTAALALLALAPGAQAQTPDSIGINFTGNSTSYAVGYGNTAGIVPNQNFNDVDGTSGSVSQGSIFDSNFTNGQATTASLTYQGTTVGESGTNPALGPNYELTKGFLDISNPATDFITLSGIGFSQYNVYVFIDGATASSAVYTVGTTAQTADYKSAFNGTFSPATATTPGDYVLFSGLSGTSFTLTGASATSAPVDGFEVVDASPAPVPEASSVLSLGLLLVLGTGGLALRARKARPAREA